MKTGNNSIAKTAKGLLLIIVMAAVVVAFLALVNRLPSLIHDDFLKKFDSLEGAKRSLGFDDEMLIPRYFPEAISWPPSLILAQKKPYKAVVIEFMEVKTMKPALIIIQSASQDGITQLQRIVMTGLDEETEFSLNGKSALLQVGLCGYGNTCSRMTWQDHGLHYTVLLMSSPFELVKIAESMFR
jgi:hypothetical protein